MIYKVFHFKSLKIVLGKTGDNKYLGYSVDPKYPIYNRPIIRGSAKEVVEVCIYLYKARLLTAYHCEGYKWSSLEDYAEDEFDKAVKDWVHYVLNSYLFDKFKLCYEHNYEVVKYSWIAHDGTPCSLDDYIPAGIKIKHWEE